MPCRSDGDMYQGLERKSGHSGVGTPLFFVMTIYSINVNMLLLLRILKQYNSIGQHYPTYRDALCINTAQPSLKLLFA